MTAIGTAVLLEPTRGLLWRIQLLRQQQPPTCADPYEFASHHSVDSCHLVHLCLPHPVLRHVRLPRGCAEQGR
eukprot:2847678-Prymnesium_polylepis.2